MKWKDSGNGDFTPVPSGSHLARCIRLIDLGTQHDEYKGEPLVRRKVLITWEIPNETDNTGAALTISKFYTQSLHEKATLRKDLTSWRGRDFTPKELEGFEAKNILDKPCVLTVIKNGNDKSVVSSVAAPIKGTAVPDRHHHLVLFSLDEFKQDLFASLPDGIKKIIEASDEHKAIKNGKNGGNATATTPIAPGIDDDDIPF